MMCIFLLFHTFFILYIMLAATLVDGAPANAAETNYKFSVKVTNVDTPKPAGDQVQVKLQACSYNHRYIYRLKAV